MNRRPATRPPPPPPPPKAKAITLEEAAELARREPGPVDMGLDAGLRRYMLSIYNYMTSGVLLTGIVALLTAGRRTEKLAPCVAR